jgi:kynurenine formamidase
MSARRFIDLSLPIEAGPSERVPVQIRYVDHRRGAEEMSAIFGIPPEALPGGLGWAGEEVTLITHAGTHMDAPWHYGPGSEEHRARYIEEVPLEWCFAPGLVLDFRSKVDGDVITAADLESSLRSIDHDLCPGEIVLIMTGADSYWGDASYPERGAGLGREATLWLVQRGVRVIGTDAWGFDRSFEAMRQAYAETRDARVVWPAHFAGREHEYCQLEKLTNLSKLPPTGFVVICFPVKVARAGAGWLRAVAMIEEPTAIGTEVQTNA